MLHNIIIPIGPGVPVNQPPAQANNMNPGPGGGVHAAIPGPQQQAGLVPYLPIPPPPLAIYDSTSITPRTRGIAVPMVFANAVPPVANVVGQTTHRSWRS